MRDGRPNPDIWGNIITFDMEFGQQEEMEIGG